MCRGVLFSLVALLHVTKITSPILQRQRNSGSHHTAPPLPPPLTLGEKKTPKDPALGWQWRVPHYMIWYISSSCWALMTIRKLWGDTLQHMMEGISGARSTLAALGGCWPDGPSQCSSITSGGRRRLDKGCCCSYISPCTSGPRRCAAAAVGHWLCPPAPSPLKGGGIGSLSETWVGIPGAPWPSLGLSIAGKSPDFQV